MPLPRSALERAPVKIDLLKGQQPLNLPSQEAFSALQGDSARRNTGRREHAALLPFDPFRSTLLGHAEGFFPPRLCGWRAQEATGRWYVKAAAKGPQDRIFL